MNCRILYFYIYAGKATNSDNQYNLFTPKFGPQESFSFDKTLKSFTKSVNSRAYSTTYANDGSVVSGTDPGGTLTYQYWPTGELKSVSTPEGMVTTTNYDKNGNRLTIDDPSAGLITNTWYGNGRQKTMVTANGDTTTWYYKTNGLPDYTVTAGKTTSYTYTVKGQVESISSPDGVSRTYSYYPNGGLQTVSESVQGVNNLVAIEYDSYRRVSLHPGVQRHHQPAFANKGHRGLRKKRIKIKASGNRGFSYGLQFIFFNTSLFKNRIQRSSRNIFVVHWYYGTFTGNRVQPNLMASAATV